MRNRMFGTLFALLVMVGALSVSMPAKETYAGSNGQQIVFYNYSGYGKISWLSVTGTGYHGSSQSWSRTFNPAAPNFSLDNWWWKGYTTIRWRMDDGRSGSCDVIIPQTLSNDWVQIGVARGSFCYYSY